MRCYYHNASEAIGVCKFCHRGLCAKCASDVDDALACKGRCEKQVAAINRQQGQVKDGRPAEIAAIRRTAAYYGVYAAAFLAGAAGAWQLAEPPTGRAIASVAGICGVALLVGSLNMRREARQLQDAMGRPD
jgi:hypothetical protein